MDSVCSEINFYLSSIRQSVTVITLTISLSTLAEQMVIINFHWIFWFLDVNICNVWWDLQYNNIFQLWLTWWSAVVVTKPNIIKSYWCDWLSECAVRGWLVAEKNWQSMPGSRFLSKHPQILTVNWDWCSLWCGAEVQVQVIRVNYRIPMNISLNVLNHVT